MKCLVKFYRFVAIERVVKTLERSSSTTGLFRHLDFSETSP